MAAAPRPIDEKSVQQILARAVELESQQRGAMTELQVREIARDLNIPGGAIEQALAEHRGVEYAVTTSRPGLPRWRTRAALILLAGVGLTAIALIFITMAIRIAAPAP